MINENVKIWPLSTHVYNIIAVNIFKNFNKFLKHFDDYHHFNLTFIYGIASVCLLQQNIIYFNQGSYHVFCV